MTEVGSIEMARGASVSGVVLWRGKPHSDCEVEIWTSFPEGPRLRAWTDTKGRFVMPRRLPPGDYEVSAYRPIPVVRMCWAPELTEFRIWPGESLRSLTVRIWHD